MPPEHGARCDQPVHPQPWLPVAGSGRRGLRGRASPAGAADLCGAAQRPHVAAPAARRPWRARERPSTTSQPQSRTRMRYISRRDTADFHRLPPMLTLAHCCSSEARRTSGTPHGLPLSFAPAVTGSPRQGGDRSRTLTRSYFTGFNRSSPRRAHSPPATSCRTKGKVPSDGCGQDLRQALCSQFKGTFHVSDHA